MSDEDALLSSKCEPVTKRELFGWYMYDWANSTYVVLAIALTIPLLVVQLATLSACPYTESHDRNITTTCIQTDPRVLHNPGKYWWLWAPDYEDDYWEDGLWLESSNCSLPAGGETVLSPIGNFSMHSREGTFIGRDFGTASSPALRFSITNWTASASTDDIANSCSTGSTYCLAGTSSNPRLVRDDKIKFSGSGDERTVEFKPRDWQVGSATITIAIHEYSSGIVVDTIANSSFAVRVNASNADSDACEGTITWLGSKMPAYSYATFVISFSVAVQAVMYLAFGAFGDYGPFRKYLLIFFSLVGCASTMLFMAMKAPNEDNDNDGQFDSGGFDDAWLVAGLLLIVSNATYGTSFLLYNSYLPVLVRNHPRYQKALQQYAARSPEDATDHSAKDDPHTVFDELSDEISNHGYALGYVGGLLNIILGLAIIVFVANNMDGLRLATFLAGAWWLLFSLITFAFVKPRPGPPRPAGQGYVKLSVMRTYQTLVELSSLPHTLRFLIAYFIYSDAYATMSYVGILFGQLELGMSTLELTLLALEVPIFALIGVYAHQYIQRRFNLSMKDMLIVAILEMAVLPVYGMIGFIPGSPIGLVHWWELYIFGCLYGYVLGYIQSNSRVLYSMLIPQGHEAKYFALYELTDKGSSWFGPLVCGALYQASGSVRLGLVFILFALLVPLAVIWPIDIAQGRKDLSKFHLASQVSEDEAKVAAGLQKICLPSGEGGGDELCCTGERRSGDAASAVQDDDL